MLPTYHRLNPLNPTKISTFRAFKKVLIFLVLISFVAIVFYGFFVLPDFNGTKNVIQIYNKFKNRGLDKFIPATQIDATNKNDNVSPYNVERADQDPIAKDRRDKVKVVSCIKRCR